jgi:hypothetical protein
MRLSACLAILFLFGAVLAEPALPQQSGTAGMYGTVEQTGIFLQVNSNHKVEVGPHAGDIDTRVQVEAAARVGQRVLQFSQAQL